MSPTYDPTETVIFISPTERLRLACWLSHYECPPEINKGRWQQIVEAQTDYISAKTLGALMDVIYPLGSAMDVIRGTTTIQVSEVR